MTELVVAQTVYLAWHGEYADRSLVGVFRSEVAALRALLDDSLMREGREVTTETVRSC